MTRFPLRIALVAVIAPFALAVTGVALQLAWLPELPDTVATHWGPSGSPDAFGPTWTMPLLLGIFGVALPALFGAMLARTLRPAGPTATQKLLAVTSLFAVAVLSIVITASLAIQRGAPGGSSSFEIFPTLGISIGVALLLAVVAWFVMPRAVSGASTADPAVPLPVAPGEQVVWVGRTQFSTPIVFVLCLAIALVTGVVVFAIATAGVWPLAIVPIGVAALVLGTASWNVRVDSAGLTVRANLGWPRYRIALADVASAARTHVVPLGEFGGYGIRWGLGRRLGIVTREGEALEVQRRDGRAVIVTVDDAATAAGLLTALAERSTKG